MKLEPSDVDELRPVIQVTVSEILQEIKPHLTRSWRPGLHFRRRKRLSCLACRNTFSETLAIEGNCAVT